MTERLNQPHSVLAAPVAPFSWGMGPVLLPNTVEDSGIVNVHFSRPVEITGLYASVRPVLPLEGDLIVPEVRDFDALLQIYNGDRKFTALVNEEGPAGDLVDLSALTVLTPRLMCIRASAAEPDLQMQFKWSQFVQGTPLFQSALIKVTFFGRYLEKSEIADAEY